MVSTSFAKTLPPSELQPTKAITTKTPFVPAWAQATYIACSAIALVVPFYVAAAFDIDDVILPALPFFVLLMAVEALLLRAIRHPSKAARYTFDNVWENFSMGLAHLLLPYLLFHFVNFLPFWLTPTYLHKNYAIVQLDAANPWTFALGFLTCDLEFYFFHTLCHTMATLWPAHAQHHNSDTFNLSVSVRQSVAQALPSIFATMAAIPFALFMPPSIQLAHLGANSVYQFWIHTVLVRDLGWLEYIFSTPAAHRIHHDRRFHKNFGGVLIIWDRFFGTYLDERTANTMAQSQAEATTVLPNNSEVVDEVELFGAQHPPSGYWDAAFQLGEYRHWLRTLFAARTLKQFAYRLVASTGFATARARRQVKFPTDNSSRLRRPRRLTLLVLQVYLGIGLLLHTALAVLVMLVDLEGWTNERVSVYVVAGITIHGMFLDGMSVAIPLEALRCLVGLGVSLSGLWMVDATSIDGYVGHTMAAYNSYGLLVCAWHVMRRR
eukprot:m.71297 g.71297  ORF g.71297 m.71297 type:complete len:493 (-) comp14206_c0_seq1:34-1512(-)